MRERRRTLLRLLQKRFGEIPAEIQATIKKTRDGEQLDRWLDQVVVAQSLAEVAIG